MIDAALIGAVGTAAAKAATGMTVRASMPAWKLMVERLRPDPKQLRKNAAWKDIKLSAKQERTIEKYLNGRLGAGILQILAYITSGTSELDYEDEVTALKVSFVAELSDRLSGSDSEVEEIANAVWQVARSSVELYIHNFEKSDMDFRTENSLFISQITSRRREVTNSGRDGKLPGSGSEPQRKTQKTRPAVIIERTEVSTNAERYRRALALVNEVRQSAAEVYGYLAMPHAREQYRIPLEELYVPRNLRCVDDDDLVPPRASSLQSRVVKRIQQAGYSQDGQKIETIDIPEEDVVDTRFVVIGNPGAGKSTFIRHLVHTTSLASTDENSVAPFVLELKSYPFSNPSPIPNLIADRLRNVEHIEIPTESIRDLLTLGLGVVIFDGLDEVTDLNQRRQIVDTIESFARRFPLTGVVVTSREEGYLGAKLNPVLFSTFRLPDFTHTQVKTYVRRWFRLAAHPDDLPGSLADSFLVESIHAADLRANPLMLSLLCMLYKYEGYIPENRPRVYEECADLLFERWDRVRRVELDISSDAKSRYLIQELAYFFFTHQSSQGGVEEFILEKVLQEYFSRNVVADIDEARKKAKSFLEYCAGRAWLLTKVGTSLKGERLFGFTHRTFMEYFVACYLVRQHPTPEGLVDTLREQIRSGSSDVIAQIAIQRFDEAASDGIDDCLSLLLFGSRTLSDNLKAEYLPFALKALRFMTPAPHTLEKIFTAALRSVARSRSVGTFKYLYLVNDTCLDALKALCRMIIHTQSDVPDDQLELRCIIYLMICESTSEQLTSLEVDAEEAILTSVQDLPVRFVDVAGMLLRNKALSLEDFLRIRPVHELFGVEIATGSGAAWSTGPFFFELVSALTEDTPSPRFTQMLQYVFDDPTLIFPLSRGAARVFSDVFEGVRADQAGWIARTKSGSTYHMLRAMALTILLVLIENGYSEPPEILSSLAPRMASTAMIDRLTLSRRRNAQARALAIRNSRGLGLSDGWASFLVRWCNNEVSILSESE